jgi:P4 family phage/plasmid primase-like protien
MKVLNYNNLTDLLIKHNSKNESNKSAVITHTRIGDKKTEIYGGSYNIPHESLDVFYKYYINHVFNNNHYEYLTEKQLNNNGPLLLDFDFRYDINVINRQHNVDNIIDIICVYLDTISNMFVMDNESVTFPIYVMEKPNVNIVKDKEYTKDGIHIIFGIQMDNTLQMLLRSKILKNIEEVCDLPITNSWDSVLDEGISKGVVNWQLYGSRKPGNEAYKLTYHYNITYNAHDNEPQIDEEDINDFNISEDFEKLTAQYTGHCKLDMTDDTEHEYNLLLNNISNKKNNNIRKNKTINIISKYDDCNIDGNIDLNNITNEKILDKAIDIIMSNLPLSDYYIKESHEYAQILPKQYYEPGSHVKNRQVAFALKNTSEKLFLSWIKLRSNADDFDYSTISSLYNDWNTHFNKDGGSITCRSILFWAKNDAYDKYIEIKNQTISHFITETFSSGAEFDFAIVLYHMYKEQYVCSSISKKEWFIYKNHRWQLDKGCTLRMNISKAMFELYYHKIINYAQNVKSMRSDSEQDNFEKNKTSKIADISIKLKKTNDKNNIMREASEIFYDKDLSDKMNSHRELLGFNNGVVDFTINSFRHGLPQDYITKTTGIDYIDYQPDNIPDNIQIIMDEITEFMCQLFPNVELNQYMWEHLASCLIGNCINQTFNIYCGSGSNGKSLLCELMSRTLGTYKGILPINVVTDKRVQTGSTSPEIAQLKDIRFAVMQEPSKDAKLNDGILKELTGGDTLQARALYADPISFTPQFNLVVCTNSLPEISTNDDGTWRRIRICNFESIFVDEITDENNGPNVFVKNKQLKEKLIIWAPIFAYMLVQIVYKTHGVVTTCDSVINASSKYRRSQDHISEFIAAKIEITNDKMTHIKHNEIMREFKRWFQDNYGFNKQPKGIEIKDSMDKKFGIYNPNKGWVGIKIIYDEYNDDI